MQWKKPEKNIVKKCGFFIFEPRFLINELREKGHEPSRAELKNLQLELWLEPARLGLITTNYGLFLVSF